jgi:hypothetical protein
MGSDQPRPPSDAQIFKRALAIALLGLGGTAALVGAGSAVEPARAMLERFSSPLMAKSQRESAAAPAREPEALTEALRRKGFHECNPHDPIGMGPYARYRNLNEGRIAIPQKGGYTDDMGYDVIVHFHGQSPVRKTLVQVSRGVVFVGVDKGIGSGRYSNAFAQRDVFRTLLRSVDGALRKHTGDERAHIRHLGLSAWSAGYGAINEILKYDADRVDAVVLLDGLHAAWNPAAKKKDGSLGSVRAGPIEPTFRFAARALAGEKLFVFTHGSVDPEKYPSTEATANLLLARLKLEREKLDPANDPFGQTGTVDVRGFHLWSFQGQNEAAHCTHIRHIARAVQLLEQAWDTPAMDRNVPFTPAPKLGTPEAEDAPPLALVGDGGSVADLIDPPQAAAATFALPDEAPANAEHGEPAAETATP